MRYGRSHGKVNYGTIAVALTGSSGIRYGLRFVEAVLRYSMVGEGVFVVVSRAAKDVALYEENIDLNKFLEELKQSYGGSDAENGGLFLRVYSEDDFNSPLASSSSAPDAMVVVPSSVKTMAQIAVGLASNVIVRGALAMLRLRRPLVLVPRETPLGVTELELMLSLARRGVFIVPAMPGFYHHPKSIDDLVDFVVGKILDVLGIEHNLYRRWGG